MGETNERFMITIQQQLVVRGFATEHHASAAEPDLNMAALNPAFASTLSARFFFFFFLPSSLVILSGYWSRDVKAENFLHPFFPIIPCPPYIHPSSDEQIRGGFRPRSGVSMGLETRRHVSASSQCLRRYEPVRTSGGRLACILSNQSSKAARLKAPLAQLGLASRISPKSRGCA